MFDVYCNFCLEQGEYIPATMEWCVHRQEDGAIQYVRCCDRHREQAVATAELMQHNMAPATVSSQTLPSRGTRTSS